MERGQKDAGLKANIPNPSAFSLFWLSELVSSTFGPSPPVCLAWSYVSQKSSFISLCHSATGIWPLVFKPWRKIVSDAKYFGNRTFMSCYRPCYCAWKQISTAWKVLYLRIPSLFLSNPLLSRLTRLLEELMKQDLVFILLICLALGSLFRNISTFLQGPDGSKWIR